MLTPLSFMPKRLRWFFLLCFSAFICVCVSHADEKSEKQKEEKKKKEPFKIECHTQGMNLYAMGAASPDGKSLLLVAKRPDAAPNLYVMNTVDLSIRPPLTNMQWGVADATWSPDGTAVAFAGFNETGSFAEIYTLELKTGRLRQRTSNNFADRQPLFSPDGKRVFFTTDESPLPDAAFGILHVASFPVAGGKAEAFTEDEGQSILPGFAPDGKGVLLVKVSEASGRHSLWLYDFEGKPLRDLTEDKLARIQKYIPVAAGFIVLWAQEEVERQESIYLLDLQSGKLREICDLDAAMRSPTVSPDGKRIAFAALVETGQQIFLYDVASREVTQLTYRKGNNFAPVFATNDRIFFGSYPVKPEENEVYSINLSIPAEEEKKKK